MAADGSIVIQTELDDTQAQKELNRLNKKIQQLNDDIYTKKQQHMPLVEDSKKFAAELDAAKAKLAEMQSGDSFYTNSAIKEQETRVKELQKEWDAVQNKVEKYEKKIDEATASLNRAKEEAGEIHLQLAASGPSSETMARAMQKAEKSAQKFSMRLREVIRSALVFTLISQGLAALRNWMGKVIKTNDEASAAVFRLKGALLTLAQPLLSVVIPAFTAFVNVLTKVVSVAAQLLAMLFGMTIDQSKEAAESLNEETDALGGVGKAAEKAAGSLAGFDEINTISTEKAGGGGGGSAPNQIKPDFDFGETIVEDKLKKILELVKLVGAALIAWKVSKALGWGLSNFIYLLTAVYSALTFVQGAWDAWVNGVSWENFSQMLLGMVTLATALSLLLGPKVAGISLLATGLTMVAVGFHDAAENGLNFKNMLTMISGMLGAGIGIGLLTGHWFPLLLAGIASGLLAITNFFGDGQALIDGLKKILEGFSDFFKGVFAGDMEAAAEGMKKVWEGVKESASAIWDAIKNMFGQFGEWLVQKADEVMVSFLNKCKSFGDRLRSWWNTHLAKYFTGAFWKQLGKDMLNGLLESLENGLNRALSGAGKFVNGIIGALNKIPGVNINSVSWGNIKLPRLAQGAVIPPNREFMAVLGDQHSGNNLEAPESLIRKIVREESGGMNTELLQAILEAIRAGQVIQVNETVLGRTTAKAINKVTQSAGKPVLLY